MCRILDLLVPKTLRLKVPRSSKAPRCSLKILGNRQQEGLWNKQFLKSNSFCDLRLVLPTPSYQRHFDLTSVTVRHWVTWSFNSRSQSETLNESVSASRNGKLAEFREQPFYLPRDRCLFPIQVWC